MTSNTTPILSWEDQEELPSVAVDQPVMNFGIPADAAQFASMLTLANSVLNNPTLGVVARYLGKPELLVNGMPNMPVIMSLKEELDALIPKAINQPTFSRVLCNHCNMITTIDH